MIEAQIPNGWEKCITGRTQPDKIKIQRTQGKYGLQRTATITNRVSRRNNPDGRWMMTSDGGTATQGGGEIRREFYESYEQALDAGTCWVEQGIR